MSPMPAPQTITISWPASSPTPFNPAGLISRDEPIAGDDEILAAPRPLHEVRHEEAEGPGLPTLVERLEALGDAVGRWRDLVRVDGVQLLTGNLGVPEDQGPPLDLAGVPVGCRA